MQQNCLYTDTYICYNDNDDDDDKHDDIFITNTITMTMTTKTLMMITSIPVVCFRSYCITTRLSVELQAQLYYTFIIKQAHYFPLTEIGQTGKWVYMISLSTAKNI